MPRPSVNNRANLPRVTTCGDDTALPRNVNIDVPYNPSLGYFSPPAPIRPRSSPFRRFRRFCLFCLFCSGPAQVMRAHKNLHEHKRQNRQNRRNRRNRQNRRTHVAARGLRRQVGVQHCFIEVKRRDRIRPRPATRSGKETGMEAGRGRTRQDSGTENGGRIAIRGRQFRPIPPPFRLDYGVPRGGIEGGIEAESRQIPGRLT